MYTLPYTCIPNKLIKIVTNSIHSMLSKHNIKVYLYLISAYRYYGLSKRNCAAYKKQTL